MKKLLTAMVLVLTTQFVFAQNVVHEYVNVTYIKHLRWMTVTSSQAVLETIVLKELNGKEPEKDMASFLSKIEELESKGWSGAEFDVTSYGSTGQEFICILRKPKE